MSEKIEIKLHHKIVEKIEKGVKQTIAEIVKQYPKKDTRIESFVTLLSFAAQIAQDIGVEQESFAELADQFFEEANEIVETVPEEIKENVYTKSQPNSKFSIN